MNKANKSQKTDNKTAKIAGILVLLAVVILVILLLLRGCGSKGAELPAQPETGTGISYDSAAVVGGWDEADMDKIVEGLNEQVEAGMINITKDAFPKIGAAQNLPLTYFAKVSGDAPNSKDVQAANVVFTISIVG